eukprot:superscaffoldBa00002371_g14053
MPPGNRAQKVRVEEELEAYPTESVELRCQFIDGGGRTKLTQVSWIWEPIDGQRDNIAVFHPVYGQSFPNLSFKDRVVFLHNTLENPSIRISDLRMSDAGRYTCEYATYPSGNEQGTTTLIMLAHMPCGLDVRWKRKKNSGVVDSVPKEERVVIGADFNGHVGEGNRGDEGGDGQTDRLTDEIMFMDDFVISSESWEQIEENLERWRYVLERKGNE